MLIRLRNNSGYSLIEMLTVITIIGILTSIAIPYYRNYRDRAKVATIQAALRQISMIEELFITERGRYYPTDATGNDVLPVSFENDTDNSIEGTQLELYVPRGQRYTLAASGTADDDIRSYTIKVETDVDMNLNGIKDIYILNKVIDSSGKTITDFGLLKLQPTLGS